LVVLTAVYGSDLEHRFDAVTIVACSVTLIFTGAAGGRAEAPEGMSEVVIAVWVVAVVLLLAHGLVYLLYLAPDAPQFSIDRSWLLPASSTSPCW
jgi:hypothetical protein